MTIFHRASRLAAAAAIAGAAGFGTAHATDWDKLQASTYDGSSATASADAAAVTDWGAEIASAFQNLGMAAARAECYGRVLSGSLPPADQQKAAELVRTASNGQQVRLNVLGAGEVLVGGFSAADVRCPKSMGS